MDRDSITYNILNILMGKTDPRTWTPKIWSVDLLLHNSWTVWIGALHTYNILKTLMKKKSQEVKPLKFELLNHYTVTVIRRLYPFLFVNSLCHMLPSQPVKHLCDRSSTCNANWISRILWRCYKCIHNFYPSENVQRFRCFISTIPQALIINLPLS